MMTMMEERPAVRRRKNSDETPGAVAPPWTKHGKCGIDLDWFSQDKAEWRECQKVCNSGCPVKTECLTYALETRQTHGVWGGADPRRLREAMGVDANGQTHDYPWRLHCPMCSGLQIQHVPGAKRNIETCVCTGCGITWERQIVEKRKRRAPKPREGA